VRQILVRPGTDDDLYKVNVGGPNGEYRPQLADALVRENARVLLAEVDNAVVGRITLERSGDEGELFGFVVAERHRRRGVGTALMDAVESEARLLGCRHMRLTVGKANDEARLLYERRGYRVVGEGESRGLVSPAGETIHEREPVWEMSKSL
jgi:ribosomal protein S18 acetylase RimI-like enzyme